METFYDYKPSKSPTLSTLILCSNLLFSLRQINKTLNDFAGLYSTIHDYLRKPVYVYIRS